MQTDTAPALHICKEYPDGVGHIEERPYGLLVSFYGPRVEQEVCHSLQSARYALRRLAVGVR